MQMHIISTNVKKYTSWGGLKNIGAEKGKDPFDFGVIREDLTRSVDKTVFVDKHSRRPQFTLFFHFLFNV